MKASPSDIGTKMIVVKLVTAQGKMRIWLADRGILLPCVISDRELVDLYMKKVGAPPIKWEVPHSRKSKKAQRICAKNLLQSIVTRGFPTNPKISTQRQKSKPAPRRSAEKAKSFLSSYEWHQLRYTVLKKRGAKCECCGATPASGAVINVDHIKPRRRFPELALVESNLQVLCATCNHGKGNWDETDWRDSTDVVDPLSEEYSRIMQDED